LWEDLFEKRSSHTHPKNFSNKISPTDSLLCKQTVDASARLAFAAASGKAPPRPYPLRKLFACGNKYEFFKKFPHKNTKTVAKFFVLMYNNINV